MPLIFRRNPFYCFKILLLGLGLSILAISQGQAQSSPPHSVLILHSYDPSFPWTAAIEEGISKVFAPQDLAVRIYSEYMDTKRNPGPAYLADIADPALVNKLQHRHFDLVIVSDNDAFAFALEHRETLFAGLPIVFCGVNNFHPAMIAGVPGITGVAEVPSYAETLEAALKLRPGARKLVVIGNRVDEAGRSIRQELLRVAPHFAGRLDFIFWDDLNIDEAVDRLQKLPQDYLVLYVGFVTDRFGQVLSFLESTRRLSAASTVPFLGPWDLNFGDGILGGLLVSGKAQGEAAARMAVRILNGEAPESIPVVTASANCYMFDLKQVQRFGIQEEALPEGSLLINRPASSYSVEKSTLWAILIVMAVLLLLSFALFANIQQRQRVEKRLREEQRRLSTLMANLPGMVYRCSAEPSRTIEFVSAGSREVTGFSPDQLVENRDLAFVDLIHPADHPRIMDLIQQGIEQRKPFMLEYRIVDSEGRERWVAEQGCGVFSDDGRLLALEGIILDITAGKEAEAARLKSEIRFSELFNHMNSGVILFEPQDNGRDFIAVDCNLAAEGIEGVNRQGLLGRSLSEAFPQVRDSEIFSAMKRVWDTGSSEVFPAPLNDRHGQLRWRENRIYKLPSGEVVLVFDDITERKNSEKALADSERRYRSLVENVDLGISLIDENYRILMTNTAQARMFRKPVEAFAGRHCHEEFEKSSKICGHCPGQDVFATGRPASVETEGIRDDGSRFAVRISAFPLADEEGRVRQFIEVVEDISDLKESEIKIRRALDEAEESRKRTDAILKSVVDGLLVTDHKGNLVMANPAAESMLGVDFHSDNPLPMEQVLPSRDLCGFIQRVMEVQSTEGPFYFDVPGEKGSAARVMQARTAMIPHRGRAPGWITLVRDVTREREIDRMKSEFIATAAHELSTPLAVVMGYAELLLSQRNAAEEERREYVATIYEKAQALEAIVDDLLNLSRIESGRVIVLERTPCDMAECLTKVLNPYRVEDGKHRFEISIPEKAGNALVDKGKMMQVMDNLLSNAVKYSPKGGLIRVRGQIDEKHLLVTVEDNGIGMTPEQVERVFDKFYRADASDTAVRGLGLGMSIAKTIVESHGGHIWVESKPGQGTKVSFTIPLEEKTKTV